MPLTRNVHLLWLAGFPFPSFCEHTLASCHYSTILTAMDVGRCSLLPVSFTNDVNALTDEVKVKESIPQDRARRTTPQIMSLEPVPLDCHFRSVLTFSERRVA
jgi:hypothetical protein